MKLLAIVLVAWLPGHSTPGAVNPKMTAAIICKKGWSTKSVRPPASYTTKLKAKQLGTKNGLSLYEEDHLISLELGGHPTNPRNLWPELYAGKCGARVKDRLEDKLHSLVCSGRLKLRDAQRAIASNWVAAYNRYVGPLHCK